MRWPFIHCENTPTERIVWCGASIPGPQKLGTGGILSMSGDLTGTGAARRMRLGRPLIYTVEFLFPDPCSLPLSLLQHHLIAFLQPTYNLRHAAV